MEAKLRSGKIVGMRPMPKKHLVVPEPIRKMYKSHAYQVYAMIAQDVPEIEYGRKPYTKRCVIEIVRDANRIKSMAEQRLGEERYYAENYRRHKIDNELAEFVEWIKVNEYNPQYRRDMDKAVAESLGL